MSEKSIFSEAEDCKQSWNETKADFSVKVGDNDKLQIAGKPVMERWETPYMHLLARSAACQGGRVLELGFGLAIAASEIERSGVKEHWIVECNAEVFQTYFRDLKTFYEKGLYSPIDSTNSFFDTLYQKMFQV